MATLGFYTSIYMTFKLFKSSPAAETEASTSSGSSSSSTIPSITEEGFDAWSQVPGNMDKWAQSLETMEDCDCA